MPEATVSQLIGSIYDSALDPGRWDTALTEIRGALDCHSLALHLNDLRHHRVLIDRVVGLDDHWRQQHPRYVQHVHAMLPPQPDMDEPYILSRHVDPQVAAANPFVRDYLRPQRIVDIMQLFLMHTPSRFAGLGLAWEERHGVVTEGEAALARDLIPHIRRAVAISDVLEARRVEVARLTQALESLRTAVFVVDRRGEIVHANGAADALLREGDVLKVADGLLLAARASADRQLQAMIGVAAQGRMPPDETSPAVRLSSDTGLPLFAHVLPLQGTVRQIESLPQAVAAVFVGLDADEHEAAGVIARGYGLTSAETRVLAHFLAGLAPAEIAETLGIGRTTARTHLGRIFSKTGVSRQAELMRLALRAAPPVTPLSR